MAWIESHQSLRDHPKTRRLSRRLGQSLPATIGYLHLFWWWAMEYAQDGQLARYSTEDIEDAVGWQGEQGEFWAGLLSAGFVDEPGEIHDWDDYAGRLIEIRTKNMRRQSLHRDTGLKLSIRQRDGDICRYCGVVVDWHDRKGLKGGTYDHVDPDGANTLENVVVACRSCNSQKARHAPEEAGLALKESRLFTPDLHGIYSTKPDQTKPDQTKPDQAAAAARICDENCESYDTLTDCDGCGSARMQTEYTAGWMKTFAGRITVTQADALRDMAEQTPCTADAIDLVRRAYRETAMSRAGPRYFEAIISRLDRENWPVGAVDSDTLEEEENDDDFYAAATQRAEERIARGAANSAAAGE